MNFRFRDYSPKVGPSKTPDFSHDVTGDREYHQVNYVRRARTHPAHPGRDGRSELFFSGCSGTNRTTDNTATPVPNNAQSQS